MLCNGNNSPKYDGKVWEEETKFIVSVNGNKVDFLRGAEIELKPGDQIVVCRPGKGGKKGRNWHSIIISRSENVEGASAVQSLSRKRKSDARPEGCPKKKVKEEKGIRVRKYKNYAILKIGKINYTEICTPTRPRLNSITLCSSDYQAKFHTMSDDNE